MTIEHSDNLERELAGLTATAGESGQWRAALAKERGPRRTGTGVLALLNKPLPRGVMSVAAVLVLCVLALGAFLPSLGKARSSNRVAQNMRDEAPLALSVTPSAGAPVYDGEPGQMALLYRRAMDPMNGVAGLILGGSTPETVVLDTSASVPSSAWQEAAKFVADRLVVRKAQIEIKAADVRTAYIKAAMILSDAQGEYVEESGLSGQDAVLREGQVIQPSTLTGTLKLRVAATRLGTVLGQLRNLGLVVNESAGGEDVTDQVVDLEARLHNEQKVEAELLSLLESRDNAPLEDILRLRASIAPVRENIERMTAQRDRLSRLVSLATVLVVIRADAAPAPEPVKADDSLGAYFVQQVEHAWERSLRTLADTAAWLVRVLVGGAPIWALMIVCVLALRLAWRRYQHALAAEPAPKAD